MFLLKAACIHIMEKMLKFSIVLPSLSSYQYLFRTVYIIQIQMETTMTLMVISKHV